MTRSQRTKLSAAVACAVGLVFAVGAATASASPSAVLRGGATVTAHVTEAKPGQACRIEGTGVGMPWRAVGADGTVDLNSGPVPPGRHRARVMCEQQGGAGEHPVGRQEDVFTGRWSPVFEFLHHHRLDS
ncbi:hypothetical protein [Nocardia blacklockiae]|uniref:hypothetical protein n=1 Tax=Nocardia blacklockiae TaxID=480036 RepID=UPI00189320CD|nr:hypothetical protein [Nocardia blacklockiae]MBF6170264.1 hypothetical protein [Nocardia blacklockiae]